MANIEEKIQKFSAFVLEDATKQRDEMLRQLEQQKKEKIDHKELELLSAAYGEIQDTVAKSRRENNERVLKIEMDLKKQLILERETMINEVFDQVGQKITAYIHTPAYKDWLIKKVKTALDEVGKGRKTIYLTTADMQYKADLEREFDQITVQAADEDDFVGGIKVLNHDRQVSVDYSIGGLIAEEKRRFLQTSGLNID